MAHDGTGAGWDGTAPVDPDLVKDGAKEIRDLRLGTAIRANKEHVAAAAASVGGEHLQGSAKCYYGGSAPTKRPDTSTNLDNGSTTAGDKGRLWIDSGVLKYWNGTTWAAVSGAASYTVAVLSHVTSAGTSGGSIAAGSWVTRTLNTELDPSSIVTLSSNQFTLAAGTYEIEADSPIYAGDEHQSRLYNVTTAVVTANGTAERSGSSSPTNQTSSKIKTVVTIAGSTVFRIEHRVTTNAQLGRAPASAFGISCVFGYVTIRKLA